MRFGLSAVCALLVASELAFLPLPGIEQDEALFVAPYLHNNPALYSWHIGVHEVPVMSMAYLGALKSWLWWPVFRLWAPGVWSMRLPECLISILTLLIFADVARRVSNSRIALAAALFLATDVVFMMAHLFDTTASLQMLGTMAFLNLLQRRHFAAGFFVAGISLWSKASFVFPLAGIIVALVAAYPHSVRRFLTVRNAGLSFLALAIGAAPLIAFNLRERGATVQAAGSLPAVAPAEKVMMMRRTIDGRAYEHFLVRSTPGEVLPLRAASLGDLALGWYRRTNFQPGSFLLPALLLSLGVLPFLRRSAVIRPLLFSWIAFACTFGSMLFLGDAGAGPHHTVLVYPAPHFIVAASAVALSEKIPRWRAPVLAAICVLIAGSGGWLFGEYYRAARQNGFSAFWTDALPALARTIRQPVAVLDWGIRNGLQIETRDRISVTEDVTPLEGVLYVGHCEGYVFDPSRRENFDRLLSSSGLSISVIRTTAVRGNGPVFCSMELSPGER